ncbi:hypothetical protein pipiens_012215 [Culex pipiens pipiens]|uniref:Uncharacterized protein n=1 Tax=Culex pipiens pipiens TaxID=38569 RepID=A0ABD1D3D5_CULPP
MVHSHSAKRKDQPAGQQQRREMDRGVRDDRASGDMVPQEIMKRHIDSEEDDRFSARSRLWIRRRSLIFLALQLYHLEMARGSRWQRNQGSGNLGQTGRG